MNLKLLTPAQHKVYEAIVAHISETGAMPSFQNIGDRLGGRSFATTFDHVHALEQMKLIKLRKGRIVSAKTKYCPTCGHRKTAGKCDDPEVHTDFIATFKEMCERGKRIEQLEKELAEARE